MRIGLLADIHGNSPALEAVLDDASTRRIDRWLNLGDVFYGPLAPLDTFRLLRRINAATVRGNEDRIVHEAAPDRASGNPTLDFVIRDLGAEPIPWLRSLPPVLTSGGIVAFHGTPQSDVTYLLEDVSSGFPRVRGEREITASLEQADAPPAGPAVSLFVCGHSHVPAAVRLRTGLLIVNPGSVGLPAYTDDAPTFHRMEACSPDASYAVVEQRGQQWVVEQIRVPYDHRRAAALARNRGRNDWAGWLESGRAESSPEARGDA